jgi:hypothetical protein
MDYSWYALSAPIQCIIKWWRSVTMNVCNKGYCLGVCGRRGGQQAALYHWYLPTKLHCGYHGKLNSKRTLSHINIACGIAPSHVWRSSSSGMWRREARCVLPDVLKQCSALEMSRTTYQMTERHNPVDCIFSNTVMTVSDHTSQLYPACVGHLKCW